MYLTPKDLDAIRRLFNSGEYSVIENTKKESYETADLTSEEHLPNYLIINEKTGAIEYAVDQLPAAMQVSNKLNDELKALLEVDADKVVQ